MSFTEQQVRALSRSIAPRHIRSRVRDGKELSYVEGWFAIAEANRIFGFDGWDRETLEAKCVLNREARGAYLAVYSAKVRLTVRTGDRTIVREGYGTGEGRGGSPGEAHDVALKAAETDATKRALVTFGKAFGLALYANGLNRRESRPIEVAAPADPPAIVSSGLTPHPSDEGEPSLRSEPDASTTQVADTERVAPRGSSRRSKREAADTGPQHWTSEPARANGIDKSALTLGEPRRVRDKAHLRHVGAQPCLLCSARPADPHHLRFAQVRALGRKVSDEFTVPLCRKHHREVHHSGNEAAWWHDMGIDPLGIARELWDETHGSP